jgi:hypothetical protein
MAIGAMETGIPTQVMSGGTGTATGSDEIGPWAQASPIAAHIAQPGVNVAGLMIFGVVVAPPATLGKPGCISLDCGSAGWGMAAIPLFPEAVPLGASARSILLGSAKSRGSAISLTTLTEQELPKAMEERLTPSVLKSRPDCRQREIPFLQKRELRTRLMKLLRDPSRDSGIVLLSRAYTPPCRFFCFLVDFA